MTASETGGLDTQRIGRRLAEIVRDVERCDPGRGWKQELAGALGVSAGYVSKLLRDPPPRASRRMMESVCQRIGLDESFFLLGDDALDSHAPDWSSSEVLPSLRRWEFYLHGRASPNTAPLHDLELALAALEGVLGRTEPSANDHKWALAAVSAAVRALPAVTLLTALDKPSNAGDREVVEAAFVSAAKRLALDLRTGIPRTAPDALETFDRLARVKIGNRKA